MGPNGAGKSTLIKLLTVRMMRKPFVASRQLTRSIYVGRDCAAGGHSLQAPRAPYRLRLAARYASYWCAKLHSRLAAVPHTVCLATERHLEKTPIQYIQWRFQDGHDREYLSTVHSAPSKLLMPSLIVNRRDLGEGHPRPDRRGEGAARDRVCRQERAAPQAGCTFKSSWLPYV